MPRPSRLVVAALAAATTFALAIAPAAAHVTVNPPQATPGGFTKLTFRVPNERSDASTTSVAIQFPEDHPLAFVSVRPTAGWAYSVERAPLDTPIDMEGTQITEAVRTITWTGGPVGPGEFQEFDVSVGPLPEDVDQLVFPAVQTYSSGEVVRWVEEADPGQEEPEHPAPVLRLTVADGAAGDEAAGDEATTTSAVATATGEQAATSEGGDDGSSNTLAVVALVVGIVGILTGIGGIALATRR